uniref:Uncharacterized protein n=1 Tax=Entomoneis paludosa TaxID=265537 RepID=A0A7S2YC63_9STRA|mmetsp:Transcript_26765/g.56031  ORF Transcript_26765/g.56031 Transcript_26765/m.56031 type:complete len:629 (+) Transcript_26765:1034-2920(+)
MGNSSSSPSSTKGRQRRSSARTNKRKDPLAKAKAAHLLFGRHPQATEVVDRTLAKDPHKSPAEDWAMLQSKINDYLSTEHQDPKRLHAANLWNKCQGTELDQVLQSNAIALLDAKWLVNYYYKQQEKNRDEANFPEETLPIILPCRQRLPPEAFLSYPEVKTCRSKHSKLQIIAVSHMWLQPSHPDPKGTTLQLLVTRLQERLRQSRQGIYIGQYPKWAIFWDYASLHQHPDISKGIHRTNEEEQLFRQGLNGLASLFSHPFTHCYKVTQFPSDNYPQGYDLPLGANCAGYNDRGWTFIESSLVSLVKSNSMVRNMSVDESEYVTNIQQAGQKKNREKLPATDSRQAPLTPQQIKERLETLSFTNAKDDRPLVLELYTTEFERRFSSIQILKLANLQWGDAEVEQLSHIMASGYTPQLRELSLEMNLFGQGGCDSLAKALDSTAAPKLKQLGLSNNQAIGDEGISVELARRLMKIRVVELSNIQMGVTTCRRLAQAAADQEGGISLRRLMLLQNPDIGNEGTELLAHLVTHHLHEICLGLCNIGDDGWNALADSVAVGGPEFNSPLTLVSLYAAPFVTEVGYRHMARLLSHCPELKRLVIRQRGSEPISEELRHNLKTACPNSKLTIF